MTVVQEFAGFVDIYDAWVASAGEVTVPNGRFYLDQCLAVEGTLVELGVGTGRIALEVAGAGREIVGVDISPDMLAVCRRRARAAGVEALLTLIEADVRSFTLPCPADLAYWPFHSIGHLLSLEDKRAALERIHSQLAPGGRLIFDHFVFAEEDAAAEDGRPVLRGEHQHPESGRDFVLWAVTRFFAETQTMRVLSWTDELAADGRVIERRYRSMSFSWLEPEQARQLLESTGFAVEALYGDFDRGPFSDTSRTQVWVARRR